MNLECLNDIITDNLAIYIDLSNLNSWDLNSDFTSFSLTKWNDAVSDNIDLIDFGLTGFDNGRINAMWNGISLTPQDTLFSMYRVGYNNIQNPTSGETSGLTVTTQFDLYSISAVTTGLSGNYFILDGGYLQGFFKLEDYNFELFPARYNYGITVETLLYLFPESSGIFFMMGTRAEDKYNPYYSGEFISGDTVTGITTSFDNYLDSYTEITTIKKSFNSVEDKETIIYSATSAINNLENNIIAFALTEDGRLSYKYINKNGLIISNTSSTIITNTGFTMIAMVFTPNDIINDYIVNDPELFICYPQRKGKLIFYVNGRAKWIIKEFPEFYFNSLTNNKEKQIGVPYSISWGGGSFGLKHSWHYDYQTYGLYTGQNTEYVLSGFTVQENPIPAKCNPIPNNDYLSGLSLSADSTTFSIIDECTGIESPITVMRIEYTGNTATTYFIKFNNLISILSNRDYIINLSLFNGGLFNRNFVNKASILVYSDTVDINIINDIDYINGNGWKDLMCKFRTTDNTGQEFINIGILIETNNSFNLNEALFIKDFTYTGADILVQDERKDNLTIEQNFNTSFIGGIQKLRIYNKAFTSTEILHNAYIESLTNSNILISKGGRIIYS
jgi:hypothetical protein